LAVGIVAIAGDAGGCGSAAALADFDEAVVGIEEVAGVGLRGLLAGEVAVGVPGIGGATRAAGGAGQGFAEEPVVGVVPVLGGFSAGGGDALFLAAVADGIVLVGGTFRGGLGAVSQPGGEFAAGVAVFRNQTGAIVVAVAERFGGVPVNWPLVASKLAVLSNRSIRLTAPPVARWMRWPRIRVLAPPLCLRWAMAIRRSWAS
jgi:hypothetical protein